LDLESKTPLISIIIPTFNSEKFIGRCLDSLTVQSCKRFEVIIQDAVSTDETLTIIRNYSQTHSFIQLLSVPDSGVYDAMNKGIERAKGSWLLFLGSDDFLIDQNVISQLEKVIQDNSQVQMIYGDVMNKSLGRKTGGRYGGKFDEIRILRQNICHQSIIYKKKLLENEMYDTRYRIYADYALNLRLMLDVTIAKLYIPLIISNFTEGGLSDSAAVDPVFRKEFSAIVIKQANTYLRFYSNKLKFLTTFFHKTNKMDGIIASFKISKNYFSTLKQYVYPALLFVSMRYFFGLYFLKKVKNDFV
jgi:glycosyltransferase involved in cell wall biosynthesis